MTTITFALPEDLDRKIAAKAEKEMLSKSALIRILLAKQVTEAEEADADPGADADLRKRKVVKAA